MAVADASVTAKTVKTDPHEFQGDVYIATGKTLDLTGAIVTGIGSALTDPGGANAAIPVTRSASVAITTAGAETNTLAIPTFRGQTLSLFTDTHVGNRVVTSAARINQAGNTIMTFGAVGDFIKLEAITIGGALRWQVVANDGVALS